MSKSTLTRIDLVDSIMQEVHLSRQQAVDLLESFLETLSSSIVKYGKVKLSSFGTFSVRQKSERIGRNPKTKKEVMISPRKTISFYASQVLKSHVENAPH